MPREALAGSRSLHVVGAVVDGQMEGVGTRAAVRVFVCIDVEL